MKKQLKLCTCALAQAAAQAPNDYGYIAMGWGCEGIVRLTSGTPKA